MRDALPRSAQIRMTEAYEADKAKLTGEALAERTRRYQVEMSVASRDNIMTKMQMIFQDPIASINPRMTVREIIAEGLHIRGVKDKDLINEKVYEMLDLVGLVPEHADRYPHEFSGGQRQRIGIARAIVLEPDLIIADEPISALDVSIQAQIINLLNDLRKRMGLTIMYIAHNLSVVKYFSDRIAVMYFGHIVEMAPQRSCSSTRCTHTPNLCCRPSPTPTRTLKSNASALSMSLCWRTTTAWINPRCMKSPPVTSSAPTRLSWPLTAGNWICEQQRPPQAIHHPTAGRCRLRGGLFVAARHAGKNGRAGAAARCQRRFLCARCAAGVHRRIAVCRGKRHLTCSISA